MRSTAAITISGSKSESNRLLVLQALYPRILLSNISDSDDTRAMTEALAGDQTVIDVHHAGTTMRFLTAYFAVQQGREVLLTGSSRMKERPIGILVDALRTLGCEIQYTEKEGFPPLRIFGKNIEANTVSLPAHISSQYISALLLIAPKLSNGLELTLEGAITSAPYIQMTLQLLQEVGISARFEGNAISVKPFSKLPYSLALEVESDWSSASYFYSIIALSNIGTEITLSSYKRNSLQGDAALIDIYAELGVVTHFEEKKITLRKMTVPKVDQLNLNLNTTPDLAQTIAVTCFGLGIGCALQGLHTLKIKETDRLTALQTELTKLGAVVAVSEDALTLEPSSVLLENRSIATYQDHRMAMAFAPLALRAPVYIEDAQVVSKSYPAFWSDLKALGFQINEM